MPTFDAKLLTKKYGPLPVWAYALGAGISFSLLLYLRKSKVGKGVMLVTPQSTSLGASAPASGALDAGTGSYYGGGGGNPFSSGGKIVCPDGSYASSASQCVSSTVPTAQTPITNTPLSSVPNCGPGMQVNSTKNGCIPIPNCPPSWSLQNGECMPPGGFTSPQTPQSTILSPTTCPTGATWVDAIHGCVYGYKPLVCPPGSHLEPNGVACMSDSQGSGGGSNPYSQGGCAPGWIQSGQFCLPLGQVPKFTLPQGGGITGNMATLYRG